MQGDAIQKRHEMSITSNRTKQQPKWWVDYNVYLDMKSHTGIYTTIGNGATYTASWNWIQKLHQSRAIKNRRSNDASNMDQAFLRITRSLRTYNNIYQDNTSIIILVENRKCSIPKRTWQLAIRYFFMTDKIRKGEVKVAFCPMTNTSLHSLYRAAFSEKCETNY